MNKIKTVLAGNVALVGLIFVLLIGELVNPIFLSPDNLSNYLRSASIMGFIAIGMTFVILCGSIDLSVGSVFSLSGYMFIVLARHSILLAIAAPVVMGLAVGLLNGILINKMSIPPFVGTLSTMILFRGVVQQLSNQTTVNGGELPLPLLFLGRGMLFKYVPLPLVFFIIAVAVFSYILKARPFGRSFYIVGGNAEAARMMGVRVERTLYRAHVLSGIMASFAGILLASRVGSAYPLAGEGYEMYAIAAVVIGGAALTGGIGTMSGTFLGTLIVQSFSNIFNLQKILNPVWEKTVVGAILIFVVFIQAVVPMYKDFLEGRKRKSNAKAVEQR